MSITSPYHPPPRCHHQLATTPVDELGTCLPGFLIIGPQKTGTSALYEYLNQHPNMELNPIKELLHWGPSPNSGSRNTIVEQSDVEQF